MAGAKRKKASKSEPLPTTANSDPPPTHSASSLPPPPFSPPSPPPPPPPSLLPSSTIPSTQTSTSTTTTTTTTPPISQSAETQKVDTTSTSPKPTPQQQPPITIAQTTPINPIRETPSLPLTNAEKAHQLEHEIEEKIKPPPSKSHGTRSKSNTTLNSDTSASPTTKRQKVAKPIVINSANYTFQHNPADFRGKLKLQNYYKKISFTLKDPSSNINPPTQTLSEGSLVHSSTHPGLTLPVLLICSSRKTDNAYSILTPPLSSAERDYSSILLTTVTKIEPPTSNESSASDKLFLDLHNKVNTRKSEQYQTQQHRTKALQEVLSARQASSQAIPEIITQAINNNTQAINHLCTTLDKLANAFDALTEATKNDKASIMELMTKCLTVVLDKSK